VPERECKLDHATLKATRMRAVKQVEADARMKDIAAV
jgi:hypothetical protein